MAVITSDFLAAVLTGYRATFHRDFDAAAGGQLWRDLAMPIPSTKRTESHSWLGTVPKMQNVTRGPMHFDSLNAYSYSLENQLYKAGFEVERQEYEDDALGLIQPRVQQLGPEAARHPGELIFDLFESGGLAFDAVAFFADTRVLGASANIDNIVAGAYGDGTVGQFQAGLAAGRAAMRAFQDDKGRPMNLTPNVLVVPPALEQTAFQACNANQGTITQPVIPATQDGAIRAAGFLILVNPQLSTVDDWYMFHTRSALKPFMHQTRLAPRLEGITNPETESGIVRDRFIYTVRARYTVGYGDPRHAVRILDA